VLSFHEILDPIAFPNDRALLVGQYGPAAWECPTDIHSTRLRYLYLKNRRRKINTLTQSIPERIKLTIQVGVQLRPGHSIYSGSTLIGTQFPEAFKSITLVIGCDFVSTWSIIQMCVAFTF
jgi:hypothetical protein